MAHDDRLAVALRRQRDVAAAGLRDAMVRRLEVELHTTRASLRTNAEELVHARAQLTSLGDELEVSRAEQSAFYEEVKVVNAELDHVREQLGQVQSDHASSTQAIVRVQDTGRGIDPAMLPRVFEPFTQADAALDRSMGGLGLGLAVVEGVVDAHGGTVTVASAGRDQGATFTLALPLAAG
jgi:light-regulated signal transduction histidine kinase (bacteriophytochrome)